jgi:hydrogenase maturation factor
MHDTTEGGLVTALNEMADSSNLGFIANWEKLLFSEELQVLKTHFNLSQRELLSTSSTGTLLATVAPQKKDLALEELQKHGVEANLIGTFTKTKKRLIQHGKKKVAFPKITEDPYARIMLK